MAVKKGNKALYTGSFDPVTYGNIDLINRALKIFDEIHVGIAINIDKSPYFSLEERLDFLRSSVGKNPKIKIEAFKGLSVAYAREKGIRNIIRGVRVTSDFDYEFQMALTNRQLAPDVETVFLMPSEKHFYLSSRLIKEIAFSGGKISSFVPPIVKNAFRNRLSRK